MIVADASVIVALLTDRAANRAAVQRLRRSPVHAPHLVDLEVQNALRRLEQLGKISRDTATDCRVDFRDLLVTRHAHRPLLERAWALRHNATTYDAIYLALAEALEAPLVTCDARLAEVPGVDATVEVYAPG